jgi:hypothetical protein
VNRIGVFLLLLSGLARPVFSQVPGPQVSEQIDWVRGALILDVGLALEPAEFNPGSRFVAEREIRRLLPGLFMAAVVEIPFDSHRSIGDRLKENPELFQRLETAAMASASKRYSRVRGDLQEVEVQYGFSFYGEGGFAVPLITHSRPYPMQRRLGFVPSRDFTGLVVYARGQLPAHGKDIRQNVRPALFPKLYDEDMNLLLSVEMCDPAYLKRWGMAAYAETEQSSLLLERIGAAPLRTVARGVFGINATDLLLSSEVADRLMVREENQNMLRQGRVLIVIGEPED